MKRLYHVDLSRAMLEGATVALLPGDPARSTLIAAAINETLWGGFKQLASRREFTSCLARIDGVAIVVTSTGIGGPSASIAVDELAQLGVKTFIRVGTTGAIQPNIKN